tara:strand:- start:413 stop:724 length:312 start_codon:yes stop_codon:yes gene_type:complete
VTDKENLLANEDRFNSIYENLKNKLQNSSISINLDEIIITINSDNPDPIEISIKDNKETYRVTYWDGYAINEFYDYSNLNKAIKKFNKFSQKALSNIEKFGIK